LHHYIDVVILARMSIPTQIGRYQIKSELGRGGMATVYRAYDPSFDREVAIKVLPREMLHDSQFRARFEREIKMVAGLEHPAIVPVYDVGDEDGQPYFVMRLMTGGSLAGMISKGKIPLEETAIIVSKIAQGLAYAHKKGIIHRDLKPDNILFDDNGDPVISDFGVARLTESTSNLTGSGVIGTPAYMSPEQAQGTEIDSRSDVYGLGVIVYQMLSGQQPYSADTPMGMVLKHITEPVPEIRSMIPSLPFDVDRIIKSAMAKDKAKRYASAVELAKALNLIAFGSEGNFTSITNPGLRSGLPTPPSRKQTGVIVAGGVALVVIVGLFLLSNQLFTPQQQAEPTLVPVQAAVQTHTPTMSLSPTLAPVTEAATGVPFAPACTAGFALPAPIVKETSKICVEKKPYTALSIPEGSTFQSLDPKMSCLLERTSDGKSIISCAGQELFSYNLKVCMPPVVSSVDSGRCDQGSIYVTANQCCLVPPVEGAGCTVFKVDLRACQ